MPKKTEYLSIDMKTVETEPHPFSPQELAEIFHSEDDPIFRHESQLIYVANILIGLNFAILSALFVLMATGVLR